MLQNPTSVGFVVVVVAVVGLFVSPSEHRRMGYFPKTHWKYFGENVGFLIIKK